MRHCNHPSFQEAYDASEYLCDSCKTLGFGWRHRCNDCRSELHDFCTRCPETTQATHLHPHHLTLAKASRSTRGQRICDICGEDVDGLFFQCAACCFDVHPLCTQLPPAVRHRAHANASNGHELQLRRWTLRGSCLVCRHPCEFWWYRCDRCVVDIHPECLVKPLAADPSAAAATETATRSHWPAPTHSWSSPRVQPPWPSPSSGMPSSSQPPPFRENSPLMYYDHFVWYFYGISMYQYQQPRPSPPRQAAFAFHGACGGMGQLHNQFQYAPPHPHHQVVHHHHYHHPHPQTPSHCRLHHPLHQPHSSNAHHHCTCSAHPPCGAHVGRPQQWETGGGSASNGASSNDDDDDGPPRKKKKRRIYALVGRILVAAVTTGLLSLI